MLAKALQWLTMKQAICQSPHKLTPGVDPLSVAESAAAPVAEPATPPAPPTFYTVAEVTTILRQRSEDTVRRAIHAGYLPAVFVGRSYLIKASDLEAFINRLTAPRNARRAAA